MRYRYSRTLFSVYGLNFSRLINSISREGIKLYKIKKEGKYLTFEVDSQFEGFVKGYLDECHIDFEIKRIKGEKKLIGDLIKRPFLILFLIVFLALFVFMENVIFDVEIIGISKVNEDEVTKLLKECGVDKPILKGKLDLKSINAEISEIEGVALSSVYIRGCVLYVEINEELDKGILDSDEYLPIVANCDCIITSIYVERGRSLVEVGQTVKKGDVLIDAYYEIDKESGMTIPCSPKGEVKGRVFYEEDMVYYPLHNIFVRSGEMEVDRVVSIFNRNILNAFDSSYENYEEEKSYLMLYPLGITLCTIKRYEVIKKEVFVPFEQVKEEKTQEIYGKLDKYIKNNVVINNKWCIIKDNGDSVTIRAYLETEEIVH